MAEVIEFAKPEAQAPATGGFVMTASAQEMLRSLQLVSAEAGGAITLISAAPGTGKTEALYHFKREHRPDAVFHTAVAGEGTPWGVACQLMEWLELGTPNGRDLLGARRRIAEEIGADGLLIIDEAQYLVQRNPRGKDSWDSLEWLRAMADDGCFSLAFCGDLALQETATRLPQLWRRMRRRVVIKHVSKEDVTALVTFRGISDRNVIEVLYQVARRGGGLGDVDNAIAHARLLSGQNVPAGAYIMAALEDLNIVAK
ncbi:AAA family ATPase [Paracoccus pantotrophus]|uniref:AAA family ATPase n=1 Tax=Paracoccus pantotrophus TaxID=82367 RepID=UPI0008E9774E|nr:AAA family ATPase [Paracoccus pantotrophus]MDF3855293.1 AAA family ATPase [Paracoccus pantotrophus]SFO67268.1 DNA transposition protein, AAA+ family ATPase [Paracoccus pantotrophus]